MRVGVIGTGRMGAFHAATLHAHPAVSRLVLYDRDEGRARAHAERLDADVAASLEDALARVDALVLATPTATHPEQIERAVKAGLPVFCEKPIALDVPATLAVLDTVRRLDGVVQVGFQRRFDAGYRRARELVTRGGAGRLYLIRVAGHDPAPPHESYLPGSGGLFRDLHIHDFDIIRYVTGREIAEVYADGGVLGFEMFARHDDVDTAVAVLRLDDGALGILSGARHDPLGYDVRMELFGSEDSVAVGWDARTPLRSLENGGTSPESAYEGFLDRFTDAYRTEMSAFIDLVGGAANPCPPEDGLAALRVAVACDLSRRRHAPVRVEEVDGWHPGK